MRVGTTLPQFTEDVERAIATARRAEELGLDGVFVFNHLWRIEDPDGPAIDCFPLIAAILQETTRIRVGPLVARVGLVPDAVLIHTLVSLQRMAGDRLIAGVGAGDSRSKAENVAYGIAYPGTDERLTAVETVCRTLRASGIETWAGGRSAGLRRVAREAADALNVWEATPEQVASEGEGMPRVTWGGQVDIGALDVDTLSARLRDLERAGADFAVCAPINAPWDAALEMLSGARDLVH